MCPDICFELIEWRPNKSSLKRLNLILFLFIAKVGKIVLLLEEIPSIHLNAPPSPEISWPLFPLYKTIRLHVVSIQICQGKWCHAGPRFPLGPYGSEGYSAVWLCSKVENKISKRISQWFFQRQGLLTLWFLLVIEISLFPEWMTKLENWMKI